jgi:hypothetical protein
MCRHYYLSDFFTCFLIVSMVIICITFELLNINGLICTYKVASIS